MSSRRPIGMQAPFTGINRIMQARFELAFNRTHSEKTALVKDARRHNAAKSQTTKSMAFSDRPMTLGLTRPSLRQLVGNADIRAFIATAETSHWGPLPSDSRERWGPRLTHVTGCAVNNVRDTSRFSIRRFTKPHCEVVALTGFTHVQINGGNNETMLVFSRLVSLG